MSPTQRFPRARRSAAAAVLAAAASAAAFAALPTQAAGNVRVNYVEPDRFTDAGHGASERQRTMTALTDYLQLLGRRLPDGKRLDVEVTEIDLAGQLDMVRLGTELRVMRGGADWPRLHLRYTLLDGERVLKSGQARLADLNYLGDPQRGTENSTDLAYEKRMLRHWFEQTILPPP